MLYNTSDLYTTILLHYIDNSLALTHLFIDNKSFDTLSDSIGPWLYYAQTLAGKKC